MAEIFQIQGKDSVLKINQYAAINAVQSFDWNPTFNEEYFTELGNADYTAYAISPEVTASFEQNATGSTVAFLKRMIQKFTTGTFDGYLAGMDPTDPAYADNLGLITGTDLEFAVCDLIEAKKANELFTRSTILPRCHLSQLQFRADANGHATETFNFEGDLAEVYRSPYQDIISVPLVKGTGNTLIIPTDLDAVYKICDEADKATATDETHVALFVMIDNVKVGTTGTPSFTWEVTTNSCDNICTITGYTLTGGERTHVVAYKTGVTGDTAANTMPTIDNPTSARFVRADDIDIFLVPTSTDLSAPATGDALNAVDLSANVFLRVQSADMSVDLRREALRQIKKNDQNSSVYYRAATYPLQVTATATVFETDLKDWAKIVNKEAVTNAPLNLGDFESAQYQLVFRYYKGTETLQTIVLEDARITGRTYRNAPGARAEVTWNLSGSKFRIGGSNTTP